MASEYLNFFSHEQVSDSLILFTEGYSMVHRFSIGVIIGADKIMVVDAGLGMSGDFRRQIEKVVGTEKPIICCCTHANIDHIASAKQFDTAYLSRIDMEQMPMAWQLDYNRRLSDLAAFSLNSREVVEYGRLHAIRNEDSTFLPMEDGDVFDLGGGVEIEVLLVPGHTPGSMAFYNKKERYVLTGDAINADSHIAKLDRQGYREFAAMLRRFMAHVGEDITFYSGHLPVPQKIDVIRNLAAAADELADGKMDGDIPFNGIFGSQTTPKHAVNRLHLAGNTLLVYNPKLIDPDNTYDIESVRFFGREQVSEHIYVVTENYGVVHRQTIGVIIGSNKVLVIDSGLGMNPDLRGYIESFAGTDKPIICALTHGAVDHMGSAKQFDEVYLNNADISILPEDDDIDHRLMILYSFCMRDIELMDHCRGHVQPISGITFKNVCEGDVFLLGGVRVEAIAVPGHTAGSLVYLCRQEKVMFTGDAVNADTFLLEMDEDALEKYACTLDRLAQLVGDPEVTLYAGHLNRGQRFETITNLAAACREVAAGDTYGDPPGMSSFVFEREKPARRLHYHGNTCVVYDRANFKRS